MHERRWGLIGALVVVVLVASVGLFMATDRKNDVERANRQIRDNVVLCATVADDADDLEACLRVVEGGSADE